MIYLNLYARREANIQFYLNSSFHFVFFFCKIYIVVWGMRYVRVDHTIIVIFMTIFCFSYEKIIFQFSFIFFSFFSYKMSSVIFAIVNINTIYTLHHHFLPQNMIKLDQYHTMFVLNSFWAASKIKKKNSFE